MTGRTEGQDRLIGGEQGLPGSLDLVVQGAVYSRLRGNRGRGRAAWLVLETGDCLGGLVTECHRWPQR